MNRDWKKVDFKKNILIYFSLGKKYKKYFIVIILLAFLISFAKIIEKLIFKELIDRGTDFTGGIIPTEVFIGLLIMLAVIYLGTSILQAVSFWGRFHFENRLETGLIFDLKKKFFDHIIELSHNFHTSNRAGSLIARLTRGSRAIEGVTEFMMFEALSLVLDLILVFATVILLDIISGFVLLITAIIFMVYSFIIMQKQQRAIVQFNKNEDVEKALISDSMMNIESIKFFGKHDWMSQQFEDKIYQTKNSQREMWDYARWMVSGHTIIIGVSLIALLIFPVIRLINGELSIGTIAFIYTAHIGLVGPLSRFTWSLRHFFNSVADFDSLTGYGDIENEIKDKKDAKVLKIKKGAVEFKDISFSYNKRKIIKNLNLKINPGERIALVGHSGSGKTTIVKLLYRLYNLNKGKILIDGKDIANLQQESLRSEMSIVPQEGILFNDTIENNIKFSKPNATKKEVFSALKKAQFDSFVKSIPEHENTYVGERGIKLSGGEKQRLSIARAILANKKILVLDEATSALDSKTERDIQKALNKLMEGRTAIIIAHRLSTIMHADKIVVMSKGKIVQIGKHTDLIRQKGIYNELWKLQKGGYIK